MFFLKRAFILFFSLLMLQSLFAQVNNEANNTNTNPVNNNQQNPSQQSNLEDIILNDFENAEDWRAFATSPLGETKIKKTIQQGQIEDVYNSENITDQESKEFVSGKNNVLGVKTFFKDCGFDRVEVKPPHEYVIKGLARQIHVWALGRGFRHSLWVKLRDYRGVIHKLRLGSLQYLGWRKLVVTIPGWLPQSTRFSMLDKNLHFVSLFVQSDPHEVRGDFYVYVDNLNVKVNRSESVYPGSQIRDNW